MTATGWTGEGPEAPAMPLAAQAMAMKERGPGDTLEIAMARGRAADARQARDEAAGARDPDEIAAAMINRGLTPGLISDLSQRLGDTVAELADEEGKLERAARRAEHTRQMHERGQIDAAGVAMRWRDTDEGDEAKVERLRRRRDSLQGQLREASAAVTPPQERQLGGVESATRDAHRLFVETTQAQMAAAQAGRPGPPPFAFRGGFAARAEEQPVNCPDCHALDADWETSVLIHKQAEMDGVDLGQRSTHNPVAYR